MTAHAWRFLYRARCQRIIDGDTLELVLDLGCGLHFTRPVRVADLWCPEMSTPEGRDAWAHAITVVSEWTDASGLEWPLLVELHRSGDRERRSFARYVADVMNEKLEDFAGRMVADGHGLRSR